MQSKKVKRMLLIILLLGVLYNLFVTSIHQWKSHLRKNTSQKFTADNVNNTSDVFGTHFVLPPHLKGKKLSFDHVYEPRQVGFLQELKSTTINKTAKTILLWTKWNSLRKTINYYFLQPGNKSFVKHNCPNSNCKAIFNRKYIHKVDAVLFHLIDTHTSDMPSFRSPQQIWILYNMEPPWQVQKHKSSEIKLLDNIFNWTMGYGSDFDIVAKYGFVGKSNEMSQNFSSILGEKQKNVVWFVSDCSTDSRREDYVRELRKFIDIDIFGKCGHSKCYPSQSSSCYEDILKNYKFYLSFENAICKDYVTEKFFNVFNYNIVPVVFGAANYSALAPRGSYIDATKFPQPKVLAETLIEISSNETIYVEFLRKKSLFRAYLDPWMCKLCNKLHSFQKSLILENVSKTFIEDSHCKKWDNASQTFIYKTI